MEARPLPVVRSSDAALWYDDARSLALGCTLCPDLDLCGGLRIKGGAYDCRSLCGCQRGGKKCSGVCRGDQREFIRRVREVGGFALDDVPRSASLPVPAIAPYVPMIYNGTNRRKGLAGGTVAVPLLSLFRRSSGTGKFDNRAEMLAFFKLTASTRIIVTGVDVDRSIERWWSFGDRPRLIESLRGLGVEMVTAPNYSLFTDVTRHDNLHNMKRIALAWAEFVAGGMPCALHVNARTDTDYQRWTEFVAVRDEVSILAFEFTTGTVGTRGGYHRDQLLALAAQAGRPLHLILRGGRPHLRELTTAFASVSVLDADPYMKTKYRQRAHLVLGGDVAWRPFPTLKGQPLDELLRHNVESVRHSAQLRRGWLRTDYGHAEPGDMGSLLQPCPA
jgi:hypothetical protein